MYKVKENLKVAISGKSGCGNTTVSGLLSCTLKVTLINYTFRQLAAEKGMTLKEVMEKAKHDDSYDKYIDTHQVELARKGSCVLGSRLAIWMLKEADYKVYLYASSEVRVKRIYKREGGDIEEIKRFTAKRDKEDRERYLKLYGIDNDKYDFCDLLIDTEKNTPEEIVSMIIKDLIKKGLVTTK